MKHPLWFTFLAFILTVATVDPSGTSNAAQLWNKGSDSSDSSGKSYFVKPKSRDTGKTLYNKRTAPGKSDTYKARGKELAQVLIEPKVTYGKQVIPKSYAFLSPHAVQQRQNDADLALQYEYNRKKETVKLIKKSHRETYESNMEYQQKHAQKQAQMEANKEIIQNLRGPERAEAIAAIRAGYTNPTSQKSSHSTYKRANRKETTTGLAKPKRLYNDPNK